MISWTSAPPVHVDGPLCRCYACVAKQRALLESTWSPRRRRVEAERRQASADAFRALLQAAAQRLAEGKRPTRGGGHADGARGGAATGGAAPIAWRDGMVISDGEGSTYVLSHVTKYSCTVRRQFPKVKGKARLRELKRQRHALQNRERARVVIQGSPQSESAGV